MNVTPVFCSYLSLSALFCCTFLSFFLGPFWLSGGFSHSLLALHHHSAIVCLHPPSPSLPLFCHHPSPCQSDHFLPSSPPFFSFTSSYFSVYPSCCHFFFSFSGGRADEWIEPSHYSVVTDSISEATHTNSCMSCHHNLGTHA